MRNSPLLNKEYKNGEDRDGKTKKEKFKEIPSALYYGSSGISVSAD